MRCELAELKADEATLRPHWRSATQVVLPSASERCAECGEPQACPTARELFGKYAGWTVVASVSPLWLGVEGGAPPAARHRRLNRSSRARIASPSAIAQGSRYQMSSRH